MPIVDNEYFMRDDVVFLARDLLGKFLVTNTEGRLTAGIITETEAYNGIVDRASHAFGGRRTQRTEIMYKEGGHAYVYLCYGIHHLFNIVTSLKNDPRAILIRAIKPVYGIETILKRRNAFKLSDNLCVGPGKVAQALGIQTSLSGNELSKKNKIWVSDKGYKFPAAKIKKGSRIGVDYAGEDAKLPYRFWVEIGEVKNWPDVKKTDLL
jgi:DNA-3-methyladenine glycosylase